MNTLESKESKSQLISGDALKVIIKESAERFSELRSINNIFWDSRYRLEHLQEYVSTPQEMDNDWNNASTYVASKILHGEDIQFTQIEPASYSILENIWLKDIKLFKSYYIWKRNKKECADGNYYSSCDNIRNLLLTKKRSSLNDFEKIKTYIEKHYLIRGRIDGEKSSGAKTIIGKKARQIHHTTDNTDMDENWFRAQLYVSMFYENIIPAVMKEDENKILNVLKAFEFSKSPENRYLIINSFEATIAIYFLNKDKLERLSKEYESYDFNMVPVKNWPANVDVSDTANIDVSDICGGRFKYDKDDKQIIYEGIMDENEKEALKERFNEEMYKFAIEQLCRQSKLTPFQKMIL